MAKRQTKQDKINAARIQNAITRLQIPMMQITALYRHAEQQIAAGVTDEQLRAAVQQFLAGK